MGTPRAFSEDAIRVYALAIAYLHDAKIDDRGSVSAMSAKEMAPGTFYVWRGVQHDKNGQHIAPVATCTYNKVAQTWKVELITGETLTLLDKRDVWVIVKKKKRLSNSKSHSTRNGTKPTPPRGLVPSPMQTSQLGR